MSTARQGASGLGLEAQQASVRAHIKGGRLVEEITEVESGKRHENRPGLDRALSLCRLHKATLVIAKLDRLARDVHFISGLMKSGVDFMAVDLPQANTFTIHIMAALAEYESKMISIRTKAALQAAKARGVKLGTSDPELIKRVSAVGRREAAIVRSKKARAHAADLMPTISAIRLMNPSVSLRSVARQLNLRAIPAPRGGSWSDVQVARVLSKVN